MDNSDLTDYLDGEADPATTARVEALLRTDPELRNHALVLMRQNALLARVLPGLIRERPPHLRPRRWWLIAAPLLAAAGIVMTVVITRQAGEQPPTPVTPLTNISDRTLNPGSVIEAHTDGPREARLPDGVVFTIAADGALQVPLANEPWQLLRGTVAVSVPSGATSLLAGLMTAQALMIPSESQFTIAVNEQGSHVRMIAGSVFVRDRLTNATNTLKNTDHWWVPSDMIGPTEVDNQEETIRGTVVEVKRNGGSFAMRTRFGTMTFIPTWHGKSDGGPDQAMMAQIAKLHPGDEIMITWFHNEHPRVTSIQVIAPAETPAVPIPRSDAF